MTDGHIVYKYNAKLDVMHVFLDNYKDAESNWYVADDINDDFCLNEIRDERNEDLVGFLILDYRRNKPELVKRYPEYFF